MAALSCGWVWAVLWIESSGTGTPDANGFVTFKKDTFTQVSRA